jgi:23S rRNA (uracil1939-C5)-methyltransferase
MKRTRRPRPAPSVRGPARTAVVTIDSIAAGGDGVARADGMVVFVPRTAPGDVAEIDLVPGARFARGALRALRAPSPDRVEPRCQHYTRDKCGGCQLQHLSYGAQLAAKARIVTDAMERIAHRAVDPAQVLPSGDPWHYRRKLTLALRRRGGSWIAGMHPYDDPGSVFALHDCTITDPRVLALWRQVMAASDDLPDADELRGGVRVDDEAAFLSLEGGDAWPRSERFFARVPDLAAVWWTPTAGPRRRLHSRTGADDAGAGFLQVNREVARALVVHVVEAAQRFAPRSLIDAYAGEGDFAINLAPSGARVITIESDETAASKSARILPEGSRAIAARVEDVLPSLLPVDVVILDPPRSGVDSRVTSALESAAGAVRGVIYVSCDPSTLARDLARMPSWRVQTLRCLDMFPQTAHVETVCVLVPEHA